MPSVALNCGVRMLVIISPLGFTLWVLIACSALILFLITDGIARHAEAGRAARRREHVRAELEPVFSRFLETQDQESLARNLRPAFLRMDAAHRALAAVLATDVMREATPEQAVVLRQALDESGIVELGHRGTRRRSPWRRALACEALGKIGCPRSAPVLLERLDDRRPEVRVAAVRALGDLGSPEAVPALSEAFLERHVAPTNVINDALRRIGGEAATAFEQGIASPDPLVRVSSCFGIAGIAEGRSARLQILANALASDPEPRVRAAAATALGIAGGGDCPIAVLDAASNPEVHVRRAAVRALGSFDDPAVVDTVDERTEDEDRETAIRAAESLLALAQLPRAGSEANTRLESSPAWAVAYARTVAEVSA